MKICQVLEVSKSGYYKWVNKKEEPEQKALSDHVMIIYWEHQERSGDRRITTEIRRTEIVISGKQVQRIMKELELTAVCPKIYKRTTKSDHKREVSQNILEQNFEAQRKDWVWLSDITCIKTTEVWLFLAVVMDLYSRRIRGWA